MFITRPTISAVRSYTTRTTKVRYKLEIAGCNYPWADSMRPYMQRLHGTNTLGAKTLELLTATWAKSTSETYGSAIKPYFEFPEDQCLPPLAAATTTMARYIAWIGERGTVKATSLQPYISAANGFFRDHCAKPLAHGDLVKKVRKVTWQRPMSPFTLAERACTSQPILWYHRYALRMPSARGSRTRGRTLDRPLFFYSKRVWRVNIFCRRGARVECRSDDLLCRICTPSDFIISYTT
jgi:hypothetical protein